MGVVSDLTFIKTFTGNDPVKIKKYVGMFLQMAIPALDQMDAQLAGSDWKSLKTTSHSLKSQMKYMGMTSGAELAQLIEGRAGEVKELDQLGNNLNELRSIVTTGVAELQAELDQL